MRGLAALLLALLGATASYAAEAGTLNNCTTAGTPCTTTVFPAVVSPFAVALKYTSGTLVGTLDCQLRDGGDAYVSLGALSAADSLIVSSAPCYGIRINLTTCGSCVYTATWRGVRQGQ